MGPSVAGEDVGGGIAVARPQAEVQVATAAGLVGVGLGHEGDRRTLPLREFLHRLLDHDVSVGHRERIGVPDVDLVLADRRLALRVLDGDLGIAESPARGTDVVLHTGALEQVVVLVVPTR